MHSSISAKMVKKRRKWKFINHMSSDSSRCELSLLKRKPDNGSLWECVVWSVATADVPLLTDEVTFLYVVDVTKNK